MNDLLLDYQIIVKIPIKALDDIEARKMAQTVIYDFESLKEKEVKLQRVHKNKSPEGITL